MATSRARKSSLHDQLIEEINRKIKTIESQNVFQKEFLKKQREDLSDLQEKKEKTLRKSEDSFSVKRGASFDREFDNIKDINDLKIVTKKTMETNDELTKYMYALEKKNKKLDNEIKCYGNRSSCRFSGMFNRDDYKEFLSVTENALEAPLANSSNEELEKQEICSVQIVYKKSPQAHRKNHPKVLENTEKNDCIII